MRTPLRLVITLALTAWPLFGCGSGFDRALTMSLVDPAKYNFHSCRQLAQALTAMEARESELEKLMQRAGVDTAGHLIGVLTYATDYRAVRDELALIEDVAQRKECDPPVRRTRAAVQTVVSSPFPSPASARQR
jgi:hypothetical protein